MPFRVNEYETRKISMVSREDYFGEGRCWGTFNSSLWLQVFDWFYLSCWKGRSSRLGARFLWLPLAGKKSAMVIILPDKSLDAVIESMTDRVLEFLADPRSYVALKLKVYIPKFELRNEINLGEVSRFQTNSNLLLKFQRKFVFTSFWVISI